MLRHKCKSIPVAKVTGIFVCLKFSYRLLYKNVGIIKAQSLSVFGYNSLRFAFYFLISTSTSNKRFQGKERVNLVPLVIE